MKRHYFANKGPSSQGYYFSSGHVECESWTIKKNECWTIHAFKLWFWRRLLRVRWTAGRSNQSILQDLNIHWKDWCWSWNSNTLASWCEELTHLKRPWCWERLRAGREEDDRGWDGWMASPTQWTWVWVNSRIWWWTGRTGMLQSMESQRVAHDWATDLNWNTALKGNAYIKLSKADICYGDLKQDFFCTWWSTCYKSNTAVSPNIYFHLGYYHPDLGWLLPVQTSLLQRGSSLTNYLGIDLPPPLIVFINVWYYLFNSFLVFFLHPS